MKYKITVTNKYLKDLKLARKRGTHSDLFK